MIVREDRSKGLGFRVQGSGFRVKQDLFFGVNEFDNCWVDWYYSNHGPNKHQVGTV